MSLDISKKWIPMGGVRIAIFNFDGDGSSTEIDTGLSRINYFSLTNAATGAVIATSSVSGGKITAASALSSSVSYQLLVIGA